MNRRRVLIAAVGAVLLALSLVAPSAAATAPPPAGSPPPATPRGHTAGLTAGWAIRSSADVSDTGDVISQPGYGTGGWLPISKPETLMAGLLENGRYPDVFFSNNLASVDKAQFDVPWWYRDQLTVHPRTGRHTFLVMNGVSSRADLWVNGTKLADQSTLQGSYSRFEYDVTSLVHDGANALALQVYPNDSDEYLTQDTVDWNPTSPDHGTGLQFAPQLAQDGPVSLRDTHVVQHNSADLGTSELTVKATLRNNTNEEQQTRVTASISYGPTHVKVSRTFTVPAGGTQAVALGPDDDSHLRLHHPAVWWPYQLGDQPMYHLDVGADAGGVSSDDHAEDFGIRTVTSHLTPVVSGQTHAPQGYRQFVVNGVPLVIRGGGWSPELFLRYSAANIHDQLTYIKNMGLNTLRFEGNFPPDDMFTQMDRAGILAMAGWQCCDKWEQDSSDWSAETTANATNQAANVARLLRDHPSVYTFYQGSDEAPDPAKEKVYLDAFAAADWSVPQVASAEYKSSPQLGVSGSKEGPYNYVPPAYWWANGPETVGGGRSFTNAGSSWGYDTETSAGNTIPTQDSLNRFMTQADQDQVWDPASTNGKGSGPTIFHTGGYSNYTSIARLGQYNTPLWNRYGHWPDMASYQRIAQVGEYEVTRAHFEAYLGHAKDPANPSTGVIYWQMNKAWPSLMWSIYGFDFDQSGVYFGAQTSGRPVHVMYDYNDHSVKVDNLTKSKQAGLKMRARVIDIDGTVRSDRTVDVPALSSQDVKTVATPEVPSDTSTTYFLELTLKRGENQVDRNVYWLSTKPDAVDWSKTLGAGSGVVYQPGGYADLTGLSKLGAANVAVKASTRRDGADDVTTVTIRNTTDHPTPAFFTRADVRRGTAGGRAASGDNQVLPIQWSQNDVTLWPGQSQTLTARYRATDLHGAPPVVSVGGWNVAAQAVSAR
jgi:hypothetical protein